MTTDQLILQHLPLVRILVVEILHHYPAHSVHADLEGAAMLALVLAARSYDPTRGVPFRTYAQMRIRWALRDEIRAEHWGARGTPNTLGSLQAATDAHVQVTATTPGPQQQLADREDVRALYAAIDRLPERQAQLIYEYDLHHVTQGALGRRWGMTQGRVSQLRTLALASLCTELTGPPTPRTH